MREWQRRVERLVYSTEEVTVKDDKRMKISVREKLGLFFFRSKNSSNWGNGLKLGKISYVQKWTLKV